MWAVMKVTTEGNNQEWEIVDARVFDNQDTAIASASARAKAEDGKQFLVVKATHSVIDPNNAEVTEL